MRLTKIKDIRGFRIFKDFTWPENLDEFARFNLIYGLNGSGKTTLTSIFSDLEHQRAASASSLNFEFGDKTVNGKLPQNASVPAVRVFNRSFIQHAIFEDPAQQELAPVFYLGEDSIEKQKKISDLRDEVETIVADLKSLDSQQGFKQKAFEKLCSERASSVKNALTRPGGRFNNYNRSVFENRAEELLAAGGARLDETDREQLLSVAHAQPLENVSNVKLPTIKFMELTQRVELLLERSVTATVIQDLRENPQLGHWVQSGLNLHKSLSEQSHCLFCEQGLPEGRLEDLEAHFNDELNRFQTELDTEIQKIESSIGAIKGVELPATGLLYQHLQANFEKYSGQWSSSKRSVVNFLQSLASALKKKRDNPFERMQIRDFLFAFSTAAKDSHWLLKTVSIALDASQNVAAQFGLEVIDRINKLIDEHNRHSSSFEQQVQDAMHRVADDMVLESLDEYQQYKTDLRQLVTAIAEKRIARDKNRERIRQLEEEIRQHLRAAEELNDEVAAYLGRRELKFEPSDSGYRLFRYGEPAYHLSEGERTAIAFMYFLKTLEDESLDLTKTIIVIDDPISSLDANSLYSAFSFMKTKTAEAAQLFILTHNFQLFRLVRNWFDHVNGRKKKNPLNAHMYLLEAQWDEGERTSSLVPLDPLLANYESEYHYLFKQIWSVAQSTTAAPLDQYYVLPNVARRLLETFLSFKFPGDKPGLGLLMSKADFDPAKKTRLLRFLHVHSHHDRVADPEHDLSTLSEAPQVFSDLLELMQTLDEDHYKGLVESLQHQ
ncbi:MULTISPECIES: AAA family ATPase [Marinobacter]|uniref:AAA family ATPase n=1 Tax=Marinobacter TaxID=2742 RepID=UPI00258AA2C9|nr:AAA family ATPase [Marinobacter salarius]WOI18722.1 AAA family ATPase [Marinobacter salarius]